MHLESSYASLCRGPSSKATRTNVDCTAWFLSGAFRSIPIVSRLDYHYPVYSKHVNVTCGTGDVSWNTVAGSPFAEEASVGSWEDLPALLDKLRGMPQEDINKLQVNERRDPLFCVGTRGERSLTVVLQSRDERQLTIALQSRRCVRSPIHGYNCTGLFYLHYVHAYPVWRNFWHAFILKAW